MKEIEIRAIENGSILTSSGQLNFNLTYEEAVNILGELNHSGDYQYFNFYDVQRPFKISTKILRGKISFRKGLISSLSLRLDDHEIVSMTSSAQRDWEKIKVIKAGMENLIQKIVVTGGKKVKGRRNFLKFNNGSIDLGRPTGKWPFIAIRFESID